MDSPAAPVAGALQPRYRRPLAFGDILDESVRLYRRHFVSFALISAVALLPSGLILVWISAAGFLSNSFTSADFQPGGRFGDPAAFNTFSTTLQQQLGAAALVSVISAFFGLLWSAALVITADAYLRGRQPALGQVYGTALSRFLTVLLSSVLLFLALLGLTLVASVLFVVTVFGLVGGLVALIGLLFWWLRPTARKSWLKWLIILTTPFGLPTYFAFRWSLYIAAIVLEEHGPAGALSRSSQLTAGKWFRVAAVLTIAPLLVGILVAVIALLVNLPLGLASASRGTLGFDPASTAISTGVSIVLQILFSSVATIVYALLFIDLRNRREGTDIAERLSQLETSPLPANG